MAGRLCLFGQRLCTNRSDNQVGVGFANPGHALVGSSANVRGSYAAPVFGGFASPPVLQVATRLPVPRGTLSRNLRIDRLCRHLQSPTWPDVTCQRSATAAPCQIRWRREELLSERWWSRRAQGKNPARLRETSRRYRRDRIWSTGRSAARRE